MPAARRNSGFTLVEVMMAALILAVGFMGLIQAVTVSSGMMDTARRETLAAQILTHEIEALRFLRWADPVSSNDIVGLTSTSSTPYSDLQFTAAIAASGAAYSLTRTVTDVVAGSLREVTFTVTWVVTTSRRKADGTPLTFTYTRSSSAWFGEYGLNLSYQRS